MNIYGDDDSIYNRFLNTNPPTAITTTATPPTAQTETPVSARFDDDFSSFLLEVDDDAVTEAPEDEEPVDGVVGVDEVVVPPVPVPVPPGVTG
jgi:hypothetical protein